MDPATLLIWLGLMVLANIISDLLIHTLSTKAISR